MASKLPSGGSRIQVPGGGPNGAIGQKVVLGQGHSLPIPVEAPKREPPRFGSQIESLGRKSVAEPVQAGEKSSWTVTVTGVGPDGAAYAASFDVEFPRGSAVTEFNLAPKR